MDYIDQITNDLDQELIAEINKHGIPTLEDYNDITNIALRIAKELNADLDIVKLGSKLIHAKIGEAIAQKKWTEHTNMALGFAMELFKKYPLNENIKNKVFICIREHRDKTFSCKEAEICANANCYKYLLPRKILKMFYNFRSQGYNFEEILFLAEEKVEQKWNFLTLEVCKKELEQNYKKIKQFLESAKLLTIKDIDTKA